MSLSRRVKALELLESLIELFLIKVKFTGAPVKSILIEIHKYEREFDSFNILKELVNKASDSEEDEFSFSEWKVISHEFYMYDGFKREDIPLLVEFGSRLGRSDLMGQVSHCEMCSGKVKKRKNLALDEQCKKSNLYLSLGCLCGTALALLLM